MGGLYSGASVAYDRPSLRAVGSNHRGTAMGWGLYTDTRFVVASAYATGPAAAIHEQRWWTNRPEGDESHLLDWDKPLSPENHARVLSAIDALDLDPRDLEATFGKGWRTEERTGGQAYELVADVFRHLVDEDTLDAFGSDLQAASEHLAAFDIDGIVSHHSDASATYVAFSDEHLQVVRRWVWDPQTQDFALDTTFLPPTPAPRRSIGGWLDQATEAHLAAEREGDVETAQRLVYEAAERAGYRYKAAHGTGHFGFTVFDPNKSDDKRSLFFAGDPTLAATYQWQATDISGYGSANTAFRDVASTIRPLELDLNAEYPNDAAFIHAVTEAVERAGGTVAVGHLEPGSGGTVEVAPHEHITLKPWPQDYILVTMPRSDGPKAFDILTPDTMVRETKALNAAKEEELRGYAARLKAEYEADPNGEYYGPMGRMSKKDRWLQAEHTLQTFLKNPQPYLEDERLTAAQSAAMATIRMNWEFYRRNDSFGIYHVALRMDNPLVIDAQGGNWSAIDIKLPGSNRKHWKTRQLAEYAQTHGYDGVQINNVYDLGPNHIPDAGRKPSSVYIVFDGKQVKSLDPFTYDDSGNLIPLSERFDTAQPDIRRSVGGSARYARADFVARATPIANDPSVKEADVRLFPIGDVPDALVRHGATPGGLITFDGKVAKMARRHDLPPERLAAAIEAMNDPVAIFLEWEDTARGRIGLSVLTDILADDGEGRQAPVRLTLISRTDQAGMLITSAYARKRSKEHNYAKVIANGGLLYVDKQRAARLPMEAETVSSLETSNVRGDPSTGTVPNREEEVKENVRRAIGGVERARRVGAAAALYYGRSPAVADVATGAIVELALLAEADRSGKRYSTQDIKDAYADFGIHADDRTAAAIADRLNDNAKAERWGRRGRDAVSVRWVWLGWSEDWRLARCGSAADRPRIGG